MIKTECGHAFCADCLSKWVAAAGTCPMCRENIHFNGTKDDRAGARRMRDRLRLRMEVEHTERELQRVRLLEQERRLQTYEADAFTVSGRPYSSLPVVSCAEARQIFNQNRRAIGHSIVVSPVGGFGGSTTAQQLLS